MAAQGRVDALVDVGGERLAVAGVELGGVVVRGLLGAHAALREKGVGGRKKRSFFCFVFFGRVGKGRRA